MEKYQIPIPISRYFEIPVLNTEQTLKIPKKITKTDTDIDPRLV